MAFDGLVTANLTHELQERLLFGRIAKVAQPEKDELILTVKTAGKGQERLLISANPSLPLLYLTDENKPSPMTAPNFCMLLRKYIAGGRIVKITQPDLERSICLTIEHRDEMGDLREKNLIAELMGKHSNIIFCDPDGTIIDSIRHIPFSVSSVREVLPGRTYFLPAQEGKCSALEETREAFADRIVNRPYMVSKALYGSYTGLSPLVSAEIAHRAGIDADTPAAALSRAELYALYEAMFAIIDDVKHGAFFPNIIYDGDKPTAFSSVLLTMYDDMESRPYQSVSRMLSDYYEQKSRYTRIQQKSSDLRQLTTTLYDRARKKYALQQKQLSDTGKKDRYRRFGELIHIYGYQVPEKSKGFEAPDYETGEMVKIPLDPTLSAMENAQKYFDRYAKLKRTFDALSVQIEETKLEVLHLESVLTSLDLAEGETDLTQIREELAAAGYIRRAGDGSGKGKREVSKPYHYRSSDGFDIYIGKNNFQNDELTFRFASGNDWWFHAKGMPGSHVLVRCPDGEMPDRTFEEAGRLAGYYSRGRGSEKVEIDYIQKKHVKKPNKSKPGFVVYYTNYSLTIAPDITGIVQITD